MKVIKFCHNYESITMNKEYEILPKSYTSNKFEYLIFLNDSNEEIVLQRNLNPIPSDLYEVFEK